MLGNMQLGSGYGGGSVGQAKMQTRINAAGLFQQACNKALWGRICALVTRRSRSLLSLDAFKQAHTIHSSCHGGRRAVPLSRIQGSEGRCKDFDRDFQPLQEHTRERWIGIAAAREMGVSMPPVELVQVGDVYYVRDGHHRISVARAMGQRDIEAEVTVWQVEGRAEQAAGSYREHGASGLTLTPAGP